MRKGSKHNTESLNKIKTSLKGKVPWNKGKKGVQKNKFKDGSLPWIGHNKPHSEETKKTISEIKKANPTRYWLGKPNPYHKGENNSNWKGGKSRNWLRRLVLVRDDFICQICGFRDPDIMEVDHVVPTKKGGENHPDNAMTLCPNCHRRKTNRELKSKKYAI